MLLPEIGGDHQRIPADDIRRTLSDLLAEVQDHDLVANGHDEIDVVLDEQDGHTPVLGQPLDQRRQL